jgi:hypothetical protein
MGIDVAARAVLWDSVTPVIELLEAAGLRVTLDITQLNPPGCLLLPPELEFRFAGGGDYTATYGLVAVVGSNDRTKGFALLSEYLSAVLAALGDRVVTGRPVDVSSADASAALMGYQLTWTTRVRGRR